MLPRRSRQVLPTVHRAVDPGLGGLDLQVEVLATDLLGSVGQADDVGLGGELDGGAPDDVVAVLGAGDGHLADEKSQRRRS